MTDFRIVVSARAFAMYLCALGGFLGCVGFSGCARDNVTEAGSQSNWLTCEGSDGCPEDMLCHCGMCTRPCAAHSECSDLHARASCEAKADLPAACDLAPSSAARVCSLQCLGDEDCASASGLSCRDGYCISDAVDGIQRDDAAVPDASTAELDVEVVITADNAYGFGYGTETGLRTYFGGVSNLLAEEIFNCGEGLGPETYTVPAADAQPGDHLYIIAWADAATTQGVLGEFRRGTQTVYTGEGEWTVCATGVRYDSSTTGPDMAEINLQIGLCNEGASDPSITSAGWVDSVGNAAGALAIGEANDTPRGPDPELGNEFPLACGIGATARWMWFNWDPQNIAWPQQTPFIWPLSASDNADKQFLIFKLGADEVARPD